MIAATPLTPLRAITTLVLLTLAAAAGGAADRALEAPVTKDGLTSLTWAGYDLLTKGEPWVDKLNFEAVSHDDKGMREYVFERVNGSTPEVMFDAGTKTLTHTYAWGSVEYAYVPTGDRLAVAVTITNKTEKVLANFDIKLMQVRFPHGQKALRGSGYVVSGYDNIALIETKFGVDVEPGAQGPNFGVTDISEKLVAVSESIYPPVHFGFADGADWGRQFNVVLRGGVYITEPGGVEYYLHGLPRVAPGGKITMKISLRFAPAATPTHEIAADLEKAFAEHHSPMLDWPDRRGIGMIMLSSSWSGHKSATNPRGWFNEPKIDVLSAAGRADFKRRAMKYADGAIANLKRMNAQGMIAWDTEAQENPHPISYIGDPRMSKILTPEFDEIADEWFKRFLDAGIRTGVCLRPTQVYLKQKPNKWDHGTGSHGPDRNPLSEDYSAIQPKDLPWWRFFPTVERLSRKIDFCKKRWGCSIYYIDTNGVYRPVGESQKFEWTLLNAYIYREIRKRHPDVLIVPELVHEKGVYHAASWAYTAPYFELDLGGVSTPDWIRRRLPGSFSVLNMCDGPFAKRRAELVAAVRRGDVLMFHGWWWPERNDEVKSVYDEVYEPGAINPGLDASGVGGTFAELPAGAAPVASKDVKPVVDRSTAAVAVAPKPRKVDPADDDYLEAAPAPKTKTVTPRKPAKRATKPAGSSSTLIYVVVGAVAIVAAAAVFMSRGKPKRGTPRPRRDRKRSPRNGNRAVRR